MQSATVILYTCMFGAIARFEPEGMETYRGDFIETSRIIRILILLFYTAISLDIIYYYSTLYTFLILLYDIATCY